MKRYSMIVLLVLFLVMAGFVTPSSAAVLTGSSYQLSASVLSGGGGQMSSSSYVLTGTLGQPSPLGAATGADFELRSGFWESVASLTMRKMGLTPGILFLLLGE